MKKILILIFICSFFTTLMASEETNSTKENSIEKESALRLVPLITSSPLLGAGIGGVRHLIFMTLVMEALLSHKRASADSIPTQKVTISLPIIMPIFIITASYQPQ